MFKITGDSSLDLTPELREKLNIDELAPLFVHLPDGRTFEDVRDFNTDEMLEQIKLQSGPPRSSCPSPETYKTVADTDEAFIITLSSNLSGSYNAARMAVEQIESESNRRVHVFDSKSASAGQTLIAMKIRALERAHKTFLETVEEVDRFISNMRTFFVLEDLSVFIKNGRIKKLAGLMATALSIVPVMCDDGDGNITMSSKARGHSMALRKLVDVVCEELQERARESVNMVIAHCKCPERAQSIKDALLKRSSALSEVTIVPTGGLSSMYANRGGIVLAFA